MKYISILSFREKVTSKLDPFDLHDLGSIEIILNSINIGVMIMFHVIRGMDNNDF